MSQSTQFATPGRQELANHPHLRRDAVSGPVSFLNPTSARFVLSPQQAANLQANAGKALNHADPASLANAQFEWRSRDNRKGRHILVVPRSSSKEDAPPLTSSFSAVSRGIWRMCTVFAWWDVSWWIAVLFTVGSAVFVASGLIDWLPLYDPSTAFSHYSLASALCGFIGATLFEIGAVLLIVEAANENQTACFGWAVDRLFSHESPDSEEALSGKEARPSTVEAEPTQCAHHHVRGLPRSAHLQRPESNRRWEWWPTWQELRTHFFFELGFQGSAWLLVGATTFYVAAIMGIPQIYNTISYPVLEGTYWVAYMLGGVLFIISSWFYMLETQKRWWQPAPRVLGWWIGVWNMIGSVGWSISAGFGYCTPHWCEYETNLTLIWASAAFMIGSLLLWYEALNKYVVVREHK